MSKLALFVVLCFAVSAFALDVSRFQYSAITETDMMELFTAYVMHEAAIPLEPTVARYNYFKSEVLRIIEHNRNPFKTYSQKITKFTGLTLKEMEGLSIMAPQNCSATNTIDGMGLTDIPVYFDWRQFGVVSPVKNQGRCGSCWAFSTVGSVEAFYSIINRKRSPVVAEQQLVDCAGDFNNHGCEGGLPSQAFEYIKQAGGIQGNDTYPYTAKDGKCVFDKSKTVVQVPGGSANITSGDEVALIEAVLTRGPVSIAFEVTKDFSSYDGGVYVGTTCHQDTQHVNHAVLAVGFGHDSKNNIDYWIVKNSWGNGWGEEGYFRIKRGVNMCGLAVCAAYPLLKA